MVILVNGLVFSHFAIFFTRSHFNCPPIYCGFTSNNRPYHHKAKILSFFIFYVSTQKKCNQFFRHRFTNISYSIHYCVAWLQNIHYAYCGRCGGWLHRNAKEQTNSLNNSNPIIIIRSVLQFACNSKNAFNTFECIFYATTTKNYKTKREKIENNKLIATSNQVLIKIMIFDE